MTPPVPPRDSPARRAYNDLRNLAQRHQRDPAEYITLYALEGLLARIAASEFSPDFVLKGGVLMAAFASRRPTRDVDLAASGFPNDVPEVEQRIREIAAITIVDGLEFDSNSVRGEPIRDEANYTGVRVKVVAQLATAKVALRVDINFGDPIWPAPTETELPLLLGGTLRLTGYPDHMVLAEKIVTAIERGELNTRWRDFTDIVAIARTRRIRGSDLRQGIDAVASHRNVEIEPLESLLGAMPELVQLKWENWRKRQRLESTTPESLRELLTSCFAFADPALASRVEHLQWDPVAQRWRDLPS
ncbi:nucleotidyl transferase AbiEii/AbiGii toxin family protein [Brevibacterium aurantiacum]|uniref:nucleotidyl transferase AbiEii/AbiGii toxin family protein n=1 Tax=Brevibacterium aurantiacum TaxID=273384 RepID=UPI00084C99A8|nr:nucleotidyl transferase AbiEii/AbiGii toxin family protein [Brevibacterium aurantiacum]